MHKISTIQEDYKVSKIDDFLNRLAEGLQLDPTRRKLVEQRYQAVSDWIEEDKSGFFKDILFEIYPQGSMAIRTTVKPYGKNEFDVDIVVHLQLDWSKYEPLAVLNELEKRLRAHETYAKMIERKNRCIRLNYAGDFHMDIMIGCQENFYDDNRLKVPDRVTKDWTDSSPRGYIIWFSERAALSAGLQELLEKAYARENLPEEQPYAMKLPLERAVQIIKRLRDIYFEQQPELKTSSIILTTIAGYFYGGQLSIYESIDHIINQVEIELIKSNEKPFQILNPSNPKEDFSEKWDNEPELFHAFMQFIKHVRKIWQQLQETTDEELRSIYLEKAFGSSRAARILHEQKDYDERINKITSLRDIDGLIKSGAAFTTSNVKINFKKEGVHNQKHRNYGGKQVPLKSRTFIPTVNFMQKHFIEKNYDVFHCYMSGKKLICKGTIQPHEMCDHYKVRIEYISGYPPQAFIENPKIAYHDEIHMYKNGSLCLYYPPDMKWTYNTKVADYTIPWIAEWIVYFELWKLTGKWEGDEVKHKIVL